ncbi:PTS transporter subunit EIIC [Pectinatus brassicae]|uniref:PTS system sucrose-specific IIC component n=1 Tax=Pectinatus brassicae TaxID=862415 RepID=A0A840UHK6_9FIRM|nr:PTS transporter subunit EIIC [Pectinatus brassicae]MBB5337221.1 PTS system sucrose-specific IIC component [Pectinatus brassicae]
MQKTIEEIHALLIIYGITKVYNCMTRMRLQLTNTENLPLDAIKKLNYVLGVNLSGSELQIIFGPGKAATAAKIMQTILSNNSNNQSTSFDPQSFGHADNLHNAIRQKNATFFKLLLKRISHIFLPLIPAFIACGLITGILNIILKLDPAVTASPIIKILQIAGSSVFWGMNIFVGINTAKELGASTMLGGTMAAIITHPALSTIAILGINLAPGRGGIIAVLLVVAFSSWLEHKLHKLVPQMLDLFLTPLLVILISTLPALFILQPIGGFISDAIGQIVTNAIDAGGFLTGFVLGGTFLPLVLTGLHQGLTPIHAELLSKYGVTILLPILAMAGAGQVGASLAVYVKTKNSRLKKTIISALPVGIMGIGEPLIYGVTLPLGRPFFTACFGGACGGAIQAFYHVGSSVMGISGLPLAAGTNNIPAYIIGLLIAYITGFIATYTIGFNDPE